MADDAIGHVVQVAAEMKVAPGMTLIPTAAALVHQEAVTMTMVGKTMVTVVIMDDPDRPVSPQVVVKEMTTITVMAARCPPRPLVVDPRLS
jgi:hypothetical protein